MPTRAPSAAQESFFTLGLASESEEMLEMMNRAGGNKTDILVRDRLADSVQLRAVR
jgi:hypothetical protein